MTRDAAIAAIKARLTRIGSGPSGVLAPGAESEAQALADVAFADPGDVEAAYLLGVLYWWRSQLLPEEEDTSDSRAALIWFTRVLPFRPDLVPIQLHSMVARIAQPGGSDATAWNDEAATLLADPFASANADVVDRAVRLLDAAVADTPNHHRNRADRLSNLANALAIRFQRTGKLFDLDRAIMVGDEAVSATPEDDPDLTVRMSRVGNALVMRYQRAGDRSDLHRAIAIHDAAVAATPPEHPELASILCSLSLALRVRFGQTETLVDLGRAVIAQEEAVAALPADHPNLPGYLSTLADSLALRYEQAGVPIDLERAITLAEKAVNGTPVGDADRPRHVAVLAAALLAHSERTGSADDLDRAITLGGEAVAGTRVDDAARSNRLAVLGRSLHARFVRASSPEDLDRAIVVTEEAAELSQPTKRERAEVLYALGVALRARFELAADPADLDRAITVLEEAAVAVTDHPVQASILSSLGAALQARFKLAGQPADIYRAITVVEEAVAATPIDHPHRAARLSNLGSALTIRFESIGAMADLDRAISVHESAATATAPGDKDHPGRLADLRDVLAVRYEWSDAPVDLDRAITVAEKAVAVASPGHLGRAGLLSDYGALLATRYDLAGASVDLDLAIAMGEEAVAASVPGHPDRGRRLHRLATALRTRFDVGGEAADLARLVEVAEETARVTRPEDPARAARLTELGRALYARFRYAIQIGSGEPDPDDLDRSITLAEEAVAATIFGPAERATRLLHLSVAARTRFEHRGSPSDLDRAVVAAREAVSAVAPDRPARAELLMALGSALRSRYVLAGAGADAAAAMDAFGEAAGLASVAPAVRAQAAAAWAETAADRHDWVQAATAWAAVFATIEELPAESARRSTGLHQLRAAAGAGTIAAALGLGDVAGAWTAAQRARSTWLGQAFRVPGPLTTVDNMRAAVEDGAVVEFNLTRWRSDALVISALGIDHVPLPAITDADAIKRANAFLAATHTPSRSGSSTIAETLAWLWDAAVGPVLDHLGHTRTPTAPGEESGAEAATVEVVDGAREPETSTLQLRPAPEEFRTIEPVGADHAAGEHVAWPRVWWIATGPLAALPLHAAGHHDDPLGSPTRRATLDRVVSSYLPSVASLAATRERSRPSVAPALIVGIEKVDVDPTPGLRPLPFAAEEAERLRAQFATFRPAPDRASTPMHVLVGSRATVRAVRSALPGAAWAHFACHALTADDPGESGLALFDGALSVREVATLCLDRAYLAYLSSCLPASGQRPTADETLGQETLSVSSALHLAGFPHVVAAIWPTADDFVPTVAGDIYEQLTAGAAPAEAVHWAMRRRRHDYPHHPYLWAGHVHIGP